MATHSSILAWETPWTKEPGGLQSMDLQRIRHDLATKNTHTHRVLDLEVKNIFAQESHISCQANRRLS